MMPLERKPPPPRAAAEVKAPVYIPARLRAHDHFPGFGICMPRKDLPEPPPPEREFTPGTVAPGFPLFGTVFEGQQPAWAVADDSVDEDAEDPDANPGTAGLEQAEEELWEDWDSVI